MKRKLISMQAAPIATIKHDLIEESQAILDEDILLCKTMGKFGAELIRDGQTVLTHCNAGSLATAGYGTALGVIRAAWDSGKRITVIADETTGQHIAEKATTPVKIGTEGVLLVYFAASIIGENARGADRFRHIARQIMAGEDFLLRRQDRLAPAVGRFGRGVVAGGPHRVPFNHDVADEQLGD